MEAWPGGPYPLGATYDGAGTNFALFSEVAERVELCLFDDDGAETRVADRPSGDALRLARLPARASAPASATATACTARTTRRTATAATRASCCSTPTPRRSTARSTGHRRCFSYDFDDPDAAQHRATPRRTP